MNLNEPYFWAGLTVTVIGAIIFFIFQVTDDLEPTERSAQRYAVLAGVIAVAAVIGVEVAIYFFVNQAIGSFLAMPSVVIATVAIWHAVKMTYRWLGGGKKEKNGPPKEA